MQDKSTVARLKLAASRSTVLSASRSLLPAYVCSNAQRPASPLAVAVHSYSTHLTVSNCYLLFFCSATIRCYSYHSPADRLVTAAGEGGKLHHTAQHSIFCLPIRCWWCWSTILKIQMEVSARRWLVAAVLNQMKSKSISYPILLLSGFSNPSLNRSPMDTCSYFGLLRIRTLLPMNMYDCTTLSHLRCNMGLQEPIHSVEHRQVASLREWCCTFSYFGFVGRSVCSFCLCTFVCNCWCWWRIIKHDEHLDRIVHHRTRTKSGTGGNHNWCSWRNIFISFNYSVTLLVS